MSTDFEPSAAAIAKAQLPTRDPREIDPDDRHEPDTAWSDGDDDLSADARMVARRLEVACVDDLACLDLATLGSRLRSKRLPLARPAIAEALLELVEVAERWERGDIDGDAEPWRRAA